MLNYNDASWETLTGPMGSEGIRYAPFNYVWKGENNCFCLRRSFYLPIVGTGTYTLYTMHDDGIEVYLNGKLVAEYDDWTHEQVISYVLPNNVFVAGENILSIYIKQGGGDAYLDYGLYYESKVLKGDVNGDGSISVADVVLTINYTLNVVSEEVVFDAADMNGDNTITVGDVVLIINKVLGL